MKLRTQIEVSIIRRWLMEKTKDKTMFVRPNQTLTITMEIKMSNNSPRDKTVRQMLYLIKRGTEV